MRYFLWWIYSFIILIYQWVIEDILKRFYAKLRKYIGYFKKISSWLYLLAIFLILLPLFSVIGLALSPKYNTWGHLIATVLPHYLNTTFLLLLGVGTLSLLIGVSTAWFTTRYEFTGKKWLVIGLLLPLAMPAYLIAYVYTDLLNYSGLVQTTLRSIFSWQSSKDYWFFNIRSLGGAIIMMSLVLYPYIYLIARTAFLSQSHYLNDAAQSLGISARKRFFLINLPMARYGIIAGLMLVLMEALNDFGTVDYFAINTLSRALWDSWNNNDLGSASQLALSSLSCAFIIIALEYYSRKKQRFHQKSKVKVHHCPSLKGLKNFLVFLLCFIPILLGLLVPLVTLIFYSTQYYQRSIEAGVLKYAANSFTLAFLSAGITLILGTSLAYSKRLALGGKLGAFLISISGFGYAFPGAVLAVGIIMPFSWFDNQLDLLAEHYLGIRTGLLFTGSIVLLLYAYTLRFVIISTSTINASLAMVTSNLDSASRSLGLSAWRTFFAVHLPLLKKGLLTASILVFVDCMKELPSTLILRPFGLETLATFVYQYTSDELLKQAAPAALLIVLVGLLPIYFLTQSLNKD